MEENHGHEANRHDDDRRLDYSLNRISFDANIRFSVWMMIGGKLDDVTVIVGQVKSSLSS